MRLSSDTNQCSIPHVDTITFQLWRPDGWRDVATLRVTAFDPRSARGWRARCALSYDMDYAIELLGADPAERACASVSLTAPVDLSPRVMTDLPAFLDDIRPAGAAARWWAGRLQLRGQSDIEANWELLRSGAIAPIGTVRVREAQLPSGPIRRFEPRQVVDRDHDFLEYALESGASVGGATGAGGEAPKLLLRRDGDAVWIDSWQRPEDASGEALLVKFARHRRSEADKLVLRTEAAYYRVLTSLGFDTVKAELLEGAREPSLWMHRFDVEREGGAERRLGVESYYSLLGAQPGDFLDHAAVLECLHRHLADQPNYDARALTLEYAKRDLVNLVFGNTDNHGRNGAVLKSPEGTRLAPIYDFAPMKLDPEGVIRTTRWRDHERGGDFDWPAIAESLTAWIPPTQLLDALGELAKRLVDLVPRLQDFGCPPEAFDRLQLARTEERLARWGLL